MASDSALMAFGPVPSRRLGRSVGVNNIPPKICTYACTYCQLGRTLRMQVERSSYYGPREILQSVQALVNRARESSQSVDYLTFVPDGEPTLDANLGRTIDELRPLGIPIAVISNASLIWRKDVREDLLKADWVSLKIDAAGEGSWRRVDRPHGSLQLTAIREGMLAFAEVFRGQFVTETMLVSGINDGEEQVREVAQLLAQLRPSRAYLAIPTRPPAEPDVRAPTEQALTRAYQILSEHVAQVEYLIGYEGNAFASSGDVEQDLLSITAVHPMREEAVQDLLVRTGAGWDAVHSLIAEGRLVQLAYGGHKFFMRKLQRTIADKAIAYRAIGRVENAFEALAAPEEIAAAESRIVIDPALTQGLAGLEAGQRIMVIFHFHRSMGYELLQHPRGDVSFPQRGVFGLRSPRRPNPIGVTEVQLLGIQGNVLYVRGLDAIDGTPVLDIKAV
ncbi:MAG: TrmO family methyltransferase domain-containing protein [Anaerolineae bacterium]